MEEKFRSYLIKLGLKGAPNNYPQAINLISEHYSSQIGKYLNIYAIKDSSQLRSIVNDYGQSGKYSEFGYAHHGRYRAAIKKYLEFYERQNTVIEETAIEKGLEIHEEFDEEHSSESVFTYERDLQNSLCWDINSLFPEYEIFGNNNEGIEYSIKGKRIDVLLIHKDTKDLLAIELKSGTADFKVFGQISMYLGLLKNKFPDKNAKGIIIAGTIDDTLSYACATSELVALKTYKMKLQLDDYIVN